MKEDSEDVLREWNDRHRGGSKVPRGAAERLSQPVVGDEEKIPTDKGGKLIVVGRFVRPSSR